MQGTSFDRFNTQHQDVIQDVSYDFYGKRLATCSADTTIKIWDLDDTSEWKQTAEWKAHTAIVSKVIWAHPEFGQVLASFSADHTVCIWEEEDVRQEGKPWAKRKEITDFKDEVTDIAFAPNHLGLKIATSSADGFIRIYEAKDIMDLSNWGLIAEWEASKGGCSCLAWNPSQFDRPALVVGSSATPELKVWEFQEAQARWKQLFALAGHTDEIYDVSWAPNLGRTFHLIASASKDKTLRIWRLPTNKATPFTPHEDATLPCHKDAVWRAEWNVTGTILASSGDDGTVCLWKADVKGDWSLVSVIDGEEEGGQTSIKITDKEGLQ